MIEYLLRVAVNEGGTLDADIVRAAERLAVAQRRDAALVSPESRFSVRRAGGIYTTDIADVLSELGFQVVIVTPLYECDRESIIANFNPRYEGHSFSTHFPMFDEKTQSIGIDPTPEVVNLLRARLTRLTHGRRSRVDVLYLENAKYFDRPYGRRRRTSFGGVAAFAGALERLLPYNYYPAIIR